MKKLTKKLEICVFMALFPFFPHSKVSLFTKSCKFVLFRGEILNEKALFAFSLEHKIAKF
jgi:hypothetical protein